MSHLKLFIWVFLVVWLWTLGWCVYYANAAKIELSWQYTDNGIRACGFIIWRKDSQGNYNVAGRQSEHILTYVDRWLEPGREQCYMVQSFNAHGGSGFSNERCKVATDPDDPVPPTDTAPEPVIAPCFEITTYP